MFSYAGVRRRFAAGASWTAEASARGRLPPAAITSCTEAFDAALSRSLRGVLIGRSRDGVAVLPCSLPNASS